MSSRKVSPVPNVFRGSRVCHKAIKAFQHKRSNPFQRFMAYQQLPSDVNFLINGGEYPPHGKITRDNLGPYAVVTTWICSCMSILFVLARIFVRTTLSKRFGSDDALILLALLMALGQSVALNLAVDSGLGQHQSSLTSSQTLAYSKSIYSSEILSMAIFCLCKLTLIAMLRLITPSGRHHLWFKILGSFIIGWTVSAIFALAFQCQLPRPWVTFGTACIGRGALLYFNGIINIMTDAVIMIWPAMIMWRVKIGVKQRMVIMGLFCSRITVCVAAAIQLSTLHWYTPGSDQTWNNLYPSLWNQVTTHLSVICACVPSMKPFFDRLQSSLINPSTSVVSSSPALLELQHWHISRKNKPQTSNTLTNDAQGSSEVRLESGNRSTDEDGSRTGLTRPAIHQTREFGISIGPRASSRHLNIDDSPEQGPFWNGTMLSV